MSLTCRNIRQLHDAFADGELSPSLTAEFHAHLLQCPACQRQIEMLQAVSDVITKDQPEPELDSGFAQRVVASIPKVAALSDSMSTRPRLAWRVMRRASLPAAAAALFLGIVFWPKEQPAKPTMVAGITAFKSVVDPTLDAAADTQKAGQTLNQLLAISAGQAREDVKQGLERVESLRQKASQPFSLTDVLWMPFDDILRTSPPAPTDKAGEPETVRF
jgi:Putative zinc-finger